jgi:hypothetical protein
MAPITATLDIIQVRMSSKSSNDDDDWAYRLHEYIYFIFNLGASEKKFRSSIVISILMFALPVSFIIILFLQVRIIFASHAPSSLQDVLFNEIFFDTNIPGINPCVLEALKKVPELMGAYDFICGHGECIGKATRRKSGAVVALLDQDIIVEYATLRDCPVCHRDHDLYRARPNQVEGH